MDNSTERDNNEICYLDEIIIEGLTTDGVKFRPSDWVDRLCGMLAGFNRHQVSYSQYLRPIVYRDMNCIAVKKQLQEQNSSVFNFIMQFATDNKLIVVDCKNFKHQMEEAS